MTTYLLKINCQRDLGGAIPKPSQPADWEGQSVTCPTPRSLDRLLATNIERGDALIIWTHESIDHGRGLGFTATATADQVIEDDGELRIVMRDVRLAQPPVGFARLPERPSKSELLDAIRGHTHRQTVLATAQQVSDFWDVVRGNEKERLNLIDKVSQSVGSAEDQALAREAQDIEKGFERRFANVELRPNQTAFRQAILTLYQTKCVISGSRISAILQAAHIVPFAEGTRFRDDASNGLLLRADLHILFDRAKIAIHPRRSEVVISKDLKGTTYASFEGKLVKHHAALEFVRRHYVEFRNRQPADPSR